MSSRFPSRRHRARADRRSGRPASAEGVGCARSVGGAPVPRSPPRPMSPGQSAVAATAPSAPASRRGRSPSARHGKPSSRAMTRSGAQQRAVARDLHRFAGGVPSAARLAQRRRVRRPRPADSQDVRVAGGGVRRAAGPAARAIRPHPARPRASNEQSPADRCLPRRRASAAAATIEVQRVGAASRPSAGAARRIHRPVPSSPASACAAEPPPCGSGGHAGETPSCCRRPAASCWSRRRGRWGR